jgi:hypothetical protein
LNKPTDVVVGLAGDARMEDLINLVVDPSDSPRA